MKWRGRRESQNVDDRRGASSGRKVMIGGGLGTLLIVVLGLLFGKDPSTLLNGSGFNTPPQQSAPNSPQPDDELASFVKVVLADTEDIWTGIFRQNGETYMPPGMVIYRGMTESGCGVAQKQAGPFYCPADSKVYIDLSFMDELQNRFNAGGDFALAYVVAHEVGHHVQNLLGISDRVQSMRGRVSEKQFNAISVRLELQADFLAGVWARHAQDKFNSLEEGDIEEALNAANAIGDDKIQMQAQGYVVPDAFTHGSSKERIYWFTKGYKTGDINQGDTFNSET